MTEAYHPHSESTKEKDEEKEKKNHKKHVTKAHLGKTASHKHVSHERPHKPDVDAAHHPVVETPPKHVAPETAPIGPDEHVTAAEEATWPDEFKKLHDEIVASVSKEDDEVEKPKKLAAETTEREHATELEDTGEAPNQVEPVLPENTHAPEVAELAAMGLPEQIIAAEEAESHTREPIAELPPVELPAAADIGVSRHEAPQATSAHEQEPVGPTAELPGSDTEPLIAPSALEQFGYGDSDAEPWGQPAGGLANPKVLEKLDSIDKRERLNDAYHGSREAGLGAVVGLVGLGLILEHFAAKRRDKKLKRQLDAQGRQLKKTNQAVQLEQRTGQTSSRKLERIEAAQAAKSVHARTITSAVQSAEAAAAATVAAAEQGKMGISSVQEKVLADRLVASKELGQAIRQNPELQGITDSQELVRSLAIAEADAAKQERQIDGLQRKVSYEKLRSAKTDNKGPSSAGGVDSHGMPVLPTPQQQLPSGVQADLMLDEHALISKSGKRSSSAIVPVAAVTVLLIIAAVIIIVFAKL